MRDRNSTLRAISDMRIRQYSAGAVTDKVWRMKVDTSFDKDERCLRLTLTCLDLQNWVTRTTPPHDVNSYDNNDSVDFITQLRPPQRRRNEVRGSHSLQR